MSVKQVISSKFDIFEWDQISCLLMRLAAMIHSFLQSIKNIIVMASAVDLSKPAITTPDQTPINPQLRSDVK